LINGRVCLVVCLRNEVRGQDSDMIPAGQDIRKTTNI